MYLKGYSPSLIPGLPAVLGTRLSLSHLSDFRKPIQSVQARMIRYGSTPKTCAVCCVSRKKPATTRKPQRANPLGVRHLVCSEVSGILASPELFLCYAVHRHIRPMAGTSNSSAVFFWTSVKAVYRALVAADVALLASSCSVSFFTS